MKMLFVHNGLDIISIECSNNEVVPVIYFWETYYFTMHTIHLNLEW